MDIYQKIAKVMDDVKYLSKDDKVEFGNTKYKAISEEKVTSTIRESLIRHGIVIIPVAQEHRREGTLSTVDVTYRIQNTEDREDYINAVSSGTGADTQDKGVGKAMTYAYKYMLLRTFAIPTGEDPDKISSAQLDDEAKKAAKKKAAVTEYCEICGKEIKEVKKKDGTPWTVENIVGYSKRRFEKQLCPDCQKQAVKTENAN